MSILDKIDPEVAQAIRQETERQAGNLEMIASENFVSEAVLEAQGSIMTNKYAEGVSREALLWRMRICGRCRNPGH